MARDYTTDGAPAEGGFAAHLIIALLLLLGLAIAVGYYFLSSGEQAAAPAGDDQSQLPVVTVVAPGNGTIEGIITAPGHHCCAA